MNEFTIDDKKIGDSPAYFIADLAANHDGDLERAKDLIYLAADAGADAAKFQHFKAETIVSNKGFNDLGKQLSHQSKWNKSVYEVYKDASVSMEWTSVLVDTCKKAGISFFTSPYDYSIVDEIDKYVPAYKIGSGDITWHDFIAYVAKKNKPTLIACGASTMEETDMAISIALKQNKNIAVLQCNTNYTASLENFKYVNLNVLKTLRCKYPDLILGLSDHTIGHATVLGAISLGAKIIEKHLTDNNDRIGPDHKFSMNGKSWKEMVSRSRELESAFGDGVKRVENNEIETVVLQRRSIRVNKNLSLNMTISVEDIESLRPCPSDALPPYMLEKVLGKKIKRNISTGDYLKYSDFDDF